MPYDEELYYSVEWIITLLCDPPTRRNGRERMRHLYQLKRWLNLRRDLRSSLERIDVFQEATSHFASMCISNDINIMVRKERRKNDEYKPASALKVLLAKEPFSEAFDQSFHFPYGLQKLSNPESELRP